jgi:hypothetical protein
MVRYARTGTVPGLGWRRRSSTSTPSSSGWPEMSSDSQALGQRSDKRHYDKQGRGVACAATGGASGLSMSEFVSSCSTPDMVRSTTNTR